MARVFEIRLDDGALFVGTTRLTPQSETVFINSGLGIEFVLDAAGRAHASVRSTLSGDYRFDRSKQSTSAFPSSATHHLTLRRRKHLPVAQ